MFSMGYTIRISVGQPRAGLYTSDVPFREQDVARRDDTCIEYHFEFTDSTGVNHRYPEVGVLLTDGLRKCHADYDPKE